LINQMTNWGVLQ